MLLIQHSAVVIDFLNSEFTVGEGEGSITVTLVKSGQSTTDCVVELRLVPGSAGESVISCDTDCEFQHNACSTNYDNTIPTMRSCCPSYHIAHNTIVFAQGHTVIIPHSMHHCAGGSDYDSSAQRTVTFMVGGDGREDVQITIVDDMILEDEEDFTIELRVPVGSDQEGLTANSSARVTIIDNDSELGMCITFAAADLTMSVVL